MDHASVENAVSLAINGGFEEETPLGDTPIGWTFTNLTYAAKAVSAGDTCPVNTGLLLSADQIRNSWFREVAAQKHPGYRSYVQYTVAADQVDLRVDLANRMSTFDPYEVNPTGTVPPYTPTMPADVPLSYFDDLEYTLCFSVEVISGVGKIETYQDWQVPSGAAYKINDAGADATAAPDLIITNLKASQWRRLAFTGRFTWLTTAGAPARGNAYLVGPVLRVTRQSQDAFVFRLTAVGIYPGHYADVPYAGDLSYLMFPRGMILLRYGETCPPGFREAELDSSFLKITSQNNVGATGGAETHTHTMPVKSVSQVKTSAFQDSASREITRFADHSHPIGEGLSVPPARTVGVCIRY